MRLSLEASYYCVHGRTFFTIGSDRAVISQKNGERPVPNEPLPTVGFVVTVLEGEANEPSECDWLSLCAVCDVVLSEVVQVFV
jgi:hypothetical protein